MGSALFLAIIVSLVIIRALRHSARTMRGSIVARDGHPTLSDEARANLEKRGRNVAKIERLVDSTYAVNERGEIVARGESTERKTPPAPTQPTPTRVTAPAAAEPDRPLYRKPSVDDLLGGNPGK
jgi:hypothetical protein